ncbi:S-layer homology domain-containing protein [[Phormidium] sp. ETS-05]|uniref:S-layer homology domain-containing protein n=1 Tax=[Phormidium] sp. ETS-05 TaxID=222819 RepID=UPI0018EEF511|nr:S-layer homology domain-containing protein [[Phormidium] sp. ETS-05]
MTNDILKFCLLLCLSGCANTNLGETLQRSVAPDPKLGPGEGETRRPPDQGTSLPVSPSPRLPVSEGALPRLPEDFPATIPVYGNAKLLAVESATQGKTQTRWQTTDPLERVRDFYQTRLKENNWEILPPATGTSQPELKAKLGELAVIVSFASPDAFAIEYQGTQTVPPSPSASPEPLNGAPSPASTLSTGVPETALEKVPPQLHQYIQDLAKLGIFTLDETGVKGKDGVAKPLSENITRREYARWLLETNNLLYAKEPGNQIRVATTGQQPAFQDVPAKDPDFAIIQGLAEAGIISSNLTGDSTTVSFRPDEPLTREDMLLWKVPLDLRKPPPPATLQAIQETWGFQDVAKVDPKSLRSLLADFQSGDLSNIRRSFGYTTLFQPKKPVSRAEAAASLWYFGVINQGISAAAALELQQSPTP